MKIYQFDFCERRTVANLAMEDEMLGGGGEALETLFSQANVTTSRSTFDIGEDRDKTEESFSNRLLKRKRARREVST